MLQVIPSSQGFAKVIFRYTPFLNRQSQDLSFQGRLDILLEMEVISIGDQVS